LDYVDGNSPRTKKQAGIYTSTEYPEEHFISLHNELSYCRKWPSRLFFCCVTAPQTGGNTLIADCRRVLEALAPALVARFEERRVRYVRNLHGGYGFGPSWQQTFETTEMDCQWLEDDLLRVTQTGPGVLTHPLTGQRVWFNQADQFHPSNHPPEYREALMEMVDGDVGALPTYACFADGSPIEDEDLDQVRACFREQTVYFPWCRGDLLMLDNVLTAHGRAPFSGPRKILVAMS
jgi:alpha-ketoglutarate-dependent taurine dioxygenase